MNDGLVIDVSLMNQVAVDPHRRRANVGAGTTLGELNSVLDTYGLHVPGGTCNDVGVAGHMMGGGYGFTSRQYRLNCDNVVGVKVMLADGTIVEGSPKVNPDLHWAIRGGTGNQFGVLLDVTYELAEVYELWGFCLRWDGADAAQVLAELQSGYMRNGAADALGYLAVFTTFSGKAGLAVVGTYNGPADEGRQQLARWSRSARHRSQSTRPIRTRTLTRHYSKFCPGFRIHRRARPFMRLSRPRTSPGRWARTAGRGSSTSTARRRTHTTSS